MWRVLSARRGGGGVGGFGGGGVVGGRHVTNVPHIITLKLTLSINEGKKEMKLISIAKEIFSSGIKKLTKYFKNFVFR